MKGKAERKAPKAGLWNLLENEGAATRIAAAYSPVMSIGWSAK
jgi:hypothetical protein